MARHPAKWHGSIRAFVALFVDGFAAYIWLDIVQQCEAGTLAACEGIRLVREQPGDVVGRQGGEDVRTRDGERGILLVH